MRKRERKDNRIVKILTVGLLLGLNGSLLACDGSKTSAPQAETVLLAAEPMETGMHVLIGGENLSRNRKARFKADSEENKTFGAALAADGDAHDTRWSSANDWEACDHWLQADLGRETTVTAVRICWERTNACAYALEYSKDGKEWTTAASYDTCPEKRQQVIELEAPLSCRYLRLHVTDVTRDEADLSLYYQNVSVSEFEIYGEDVDSFDLQAPLLTEGTNRKIPVPEVPEGYVLSFGGLDYDNLVTEEGLLADTIADTTASFGYVLTKGEKQFDLPGMELTIPASEPIGEDENNPILPKQISAAQWRPSGCFVTWSYCGTAEEILVDPAEGYSLGAEGFQLEIGRAGEDCDGPVCVRSCDGENKDCASIRILAETATGLERGRLRLEQLAAIESGVLPCGILRDYPRYEVRGFGIDVGRRPISMKLLHRLVDELAAAGMNTLQVHLNDNQIITMSEYDGTVEGARKLYSGFRIETELVGEDGSSLSSKDLCYTTEEFRELVAYGAERGITVVPELDTPAHCLALTKAYPSYGFADSPELADTLDVSKPEVRQLVRSLWEEQLKAGGAFEQAEVLHLGMDEYFGDFKDYLSYVEEITNAVEKMAPDKTRRIWGSLTYKEGDRSKISRDTEVMVWNLEWADPEVLYEEGFSLINCLNADLYLIPGAGTDHLDVQWLSEGWAPNRYVIPEREVELPVWSDQVKGACYMLWNDASGLAGVEELTEEELLERILEPLSVIADKLW